MPEPLQIDGWVALSAVAQEHVGEGWIFRGVQKVTYELIPKIGRPDWRRVPDRPPGEIRPLTKTDERILLGKFKRYARPFLSYPPEGDIEWLAIAQHHGLPTRLLDWSESILVAAYFAVEEADYKNGAAVYAYRPSKFSSLPNDLDPFEIEFGGVYRPTHATPRIAAQRGVFTISDPLGPLIAEEDEELKKYLLPPAACFEIKRTLDACAFNRAILFPDLDGLCASLAWRQKWGFPP